MNINRRWLMFGIPALFLLLWSAGFSVAKIGISDADPMTLLALRYFCVLVLLLPVCVALKPALPTSGRAWLHLAWVGFLIQVVYFGAAWTAMDRGMPAGTVAVVTSLYPILVAVVMPQISTERVNLRQWSGLLLGLTGSLLVIVSSTDLKLDTGVALTFAVLSLLAFTLGTVWEKRYGGTYHPLLANTVQYVVGFLCTLPLALLFEPLEIQWTVPFVMSLGYLVVGNSILAISLLLIMIRHGEATRVAALFFLVPPLSALIAWWLLGESLAPLAWFGMIVAATGVFIVTRRNPATAATQRTGLIKSSAD